MRMRSLVTAGLLATAAAGLAACGQPSEAAAPPSTTTSSSTTTTMPPTTTTTMDLAVLEVESIDWTYIDQYMKLDELPADVRAAMHKFGKDYEESLRLTCIALVGGVDVDDIWITWGTGFQTKIDALKYLSPKAGQTFEQEIRSSMRGSCGITNASAMRDLHILATT